VSRFLRILFLCVFLYPLSCYKGYGLSPTALELSSGIQGRVFFNGTWPDSTNQVFVIVSKQYPKGITGRDSLLAFVIQNLENGNIVIGDTIPNFVIYYDYQVNLQPGLYEWLLVVWFPKEIFGVKELGAYYQNPGKQTLPSPIDVLPGVMVKGINVVADFSNINNQTPFFKR
jgi:hypothetical protein